MTITNPVEKIGLHNPLVARDVDFRSPIPEPNRRGPHRSSCGMAARRLTHFPKSFLGMWLKRMGVLEIRLKV
ncbi:MAG: hypothetical protein A4E48_02665 [Methanosaeta sp. PtaU1.Bin060]|nr:MAG: hypothetical protein A4E48_02665 [Methanosaeta sp. PtaU1.Bin060]